MARVRDDPQPAWEICGLVDLDSATVAMGDAHALAKPRDPGTPLTVIDERRVTILVTREDAEYPVEKLVDRGRVIGVRVELVTDVAEVAGSWVFQREITVGSDFIVVVDPCRELRTESLDASAGMADVDLAFPNGVVHGCAVRAEPGSWRVEVFRAADGDELGLRLLRDMSHGPAEEWRDASAVAR